MHSELLDVFLRILLLRARVLLEVVFCKASSNDSTTGPRVIHLVIPNNATWSFSRDHVSDVLDTLIVEVKVTEV